MDLGCPGNVSFERTNRSSALCLRHARMYNIHLQNTHIILIKFALCWAISLLESI